MDAGEISLSSDSVNCTAAADISLSSSTRALYVETRMPVSEERELVIVHSPDRFIGPVAMMTFTNIGFLGYAGWKFPYR